MEEDQMAIYHKHLIELEIEKITKQAIESGIDPKEYADMLWKKEFGREWGEST